MPTLVLVAPADNHGGTAEDAGAQQPTLRAFQPEGTAEFVFFLSLEQKVRQALPNQRPSPHRRAHSVAQPGPRRPPGGSAAPDRPRSAAPPGDGS